MSAQQMRVILDDNAGVIKYGTGWDTNDQVMWYQGSTNFPSFSGPGLCSFSLTFQGKCRGIFQNIGMILISMDRHICCIHWKYAVAHFFTISYFCTRWRLTLQLELRFSPWATVICAMVPVADRE